MKAYTLAVDYYNSGNLAKAQKICSDIIKENPGYAEAYYLLGLVALKNDDLLVAKDFFKEAIKYKSNFAEAYCCLGRVLGKLGDNKNALFCLNESIKIDKEYAKAYFYIAIILQLSNLEDEAIEFYNSAIKYKPDFQEAYSNLSVILLEKGKADEALSAVLKAISIQPNNPFTLNNLGKVYCRFNEYEKAINCFKKAISVKNDMIEPYVNLSSCYLNMREMEQAIHFSNLALKINSSYTMARWNRAMIDLLVGNFGEGWKNYEWRWGLKDFMKIKRNYKQPKWDGSFAPDKVLFIYAEQGLGDTIQFIRYARLTKERVKKVIVEVQSSLVKLLSKTPGIDKIVSSEDLPPEFDIQIPLLSLPRLFKTTLSSIPSEVPYIFTSDEKDKKFRCFFSKQDSRIINVGIVWAGSKLHLNDHNRSSQLSYFVEFLRLKDVKLFSLQKCPSEVEKDIMFKSGVVDLDEELSDFSDTAEIISNLDLVVSVDTAVAHLAGAMNKPVWLLLPFNSDWRWMLNGGKSPWYPSMTIFRQLKLGDWKSVFKKVRESLLALRHRAM